MSENLEKVVTSEFFWGVLVSAVGFLIVHFFDLFLLSPFREWREIRSKIAVNLQFYANISSNLGGNADIFKERYLEMGREYRTRSAEITAYFVNHRQIFRFFYASNDKLKKINSKLIYFSNLNNRHDEIAKSVKLKDDLKDILGLNQLDS